MFHQERKLFEEVGGFELRVFVKDEEKFVFQVLLKCLNTLKTDVCRNKRAFRMEVILFERICHVGIEICCLLSEWSVHAGL